MVISILFFISLLSIFWNYYLFTENYYLKKRNKQLDTEVSITMNRPFEHK